MRATTIADNWQVAERTTGGEKNWIPAQVPGHVHLDLMRAGIIADPFWRMQERSCQWVDEADWTYRTTVTVDAERLASRGAHGRHFLHFHGLDTIARVFLNGALVGSAENFHIPHRFDVTETLKEGENDLRVEFDSALRVGQERATAYLGDGTSERGSQSYFNFGPRAFVRKPQYMFGWDWGPELVSCGIWQKVELVTVPIAEIVDWKYDYEFTSENTVSVTVTAEIERYSPDAPLTLETWSQSKLAGQIDVSLGAGQHRVRVTLPEREVKRWNPTGLPGPRLLYAYHLAITDPAQRQSTREPAIHQIEFMCTFRTIELVRETDGDGKGEGFKFRINGVDTFIKGANWIPNDSFPARTLTSIPKPGPDWAKNPLWKQLCQVQQAGYNMLRVWGGGLYETEEFYRMCDMLGILVWQDFAFACSMYPDDEEWFVEQVRGEAVAAVRRIRNHPCLALWCGGNENLELFQGRWDGKTQATKFFGDRLIHETLPAVLEAEDSRTPYWPNSPYGGENSTSEDYGDSHYWNVWHSKLPGSNGDWPNYLLSTSRFSSEFGFAAPCGYAAWDKAAAPDDRFVRSPVARWHDKTRKGYETYLNFIAMHYPAPQTFDDLIYYGQANQADALKCGIEHWRRLKGRCWGTLFWQFNDCWPVQSWSVIDSEGDPKAAYYASKRFYAPLLLSLATPSPTAWERGLGGGGQFAAFLTNDTLQNISGQLVLRLLTFDGEEIARQETNAVAPANAASGSLLLIDLPDVTRAADAFVHATFTGGDGSVLAENFLLLAEPKDARLPDPGLAWDIRMNGQGEATITVSARRFAGYLWLRFDDMPHPTFSENWFHLAPGQTRTVTLGQLPRDITADALRARLRVRHL